MVTNAQEDLIKNISELVKWSKILTSTLVNSDVKGLQEVTEDFDKLLQNIKEALGEYFNEETHFTSMQEELYRLKRANEINKELLLSWNQECEYLISKFFMVDEGEPIIYMDDGKMRKRVSRRIDERV